MCWSTSTASGPSWTPSAASTSASPTLARRQVGPRHPRGRLPAPQRRPGPRPGPQPLLLLSGRRRLAQRPLGRPGPHPPPAGVPPGRDQGGPGQGPDQPRPGQRLCQLPGPRDHQGQRPAGQRRHPHRGRLPLLQPLQAGHLHPPGERQHRPSPRRRPRPQAARRRDRGQQLPRPPHPRPGGGPGAAVPADTQVSVLNALGTTGLAASTATKLRRSGYRITTVGNAPSADLPKSQIAYAPGRLADAKTLATTLIGGASLVEDPSLTASNLTLILGPGSRGSARWRRMGRAQVARPARVTSARAGRPVSRGRTPRNRRRRRRQFPTSARTTPGPANRPARGGRVTSPNSRARSSAMQPPVAVVVAESRAPSGSLALWSSGSRAPGSRRALGSGEGPGSRRALGSGESDPMHAPGSGLQAPVLEAASAGPAPTVLEAAELQDRPAKPEPLLNREAVFASARTRTWAHIRPRPADQPCAAGRPRATGPPGAAGPVFALLALPAPRTTSFPAGPGPRVRAVQRDGSDARRTWNDELRHAGSRSGGPRPARFRAAGSRAAGSRERPGLADPVTECCRQQSAEARDVVH